MRNETRILLGALALLVVAGCTTSPVEVERDYGNSVRQMIASQTLDPAASANPDPEGPESGDGQRLNKVIDVYRSDVAKPEEVGQPIVISVGGQ